MAAVYVAIKFSGSCHYLDINAPASATEKMRIWFGARDEGGGGE